MSPGKAGRHGPGHHATQANQHAQKMSEAIKAATAAAPQPTPGPWQPSPAQKGSEPIVSTTSLPGGVDWNPLGQKAKAPASNPGLNIGKPGGPTSIRGAMAQTPAAAPAKKPDPL